MYYRNYIVPWLRAKLIDELNAMSIEQVKALWERIGSDDEVNPEAPDGYYGHLIFEVLTARGVLPPKLL